MERVCPLVRLRDNAHRSELSALCVRTNSRNECLFNRFDREYGQSIKTGRLHIELQGGGRMINRSSTVEIVAVERGWIEMSLVTCESSK